MMLVIPLALVAGCNVDNDAKNDQVTLEYNQQQVEKTARDAARTAEGVASSVGNVAADTGRAIQKEVGDVNVDVDVTRNRSSENNKSGEAK
jgi:hypothetical protein